VPDLRNTKVIDIIKGLRGHGLAVDVHDPFADPAEAEREFGVRLISRLPSGNGYNCIVGAVAHDEYLELPARALARIAAPGALIADIKGMWRDLPLPEGMRRWEL